MLKDFMFSPKDGFSIWFDKKLKKEYYITQIEMCKTTFVRKRYDKFKSIKLIDKYSTEFTEEKPIYHSSSDLVDPFEENYGMFLINFLNADFSTFESAYLTFFCFYGMKLLAEFYEELPKIRAYKSEQDFKSTYEEIFNKCKAKLKVVQDEIKLSVNHTYNLKKQYKNKEYSYIEKYISQAITDNLFKYATNINIYFNVNYAYKINDILSTKITPKIVKSKIEERIINPTESNIFNSKCISNIAFVSLNEIATNPNVSIGTCKNCGKYFISYQKEPEKYCRITYSENEVICKDTGIQVAYKKKQEKNPCLALYRKTYQKKLMYAKRSEDENVKQEFNNWKILAKEKVKDFNNGVISAKELSEWLKSK